MMLNLLYFPLACKSVHIPGRTLDSGSSLNCRSHSKDCSSDTAGPQGKSISGQEYPSLFGCSLCFVRFPAAQIISISAFRMLLFFLDFSYAIIRVLLCRAPCGSSSSQPAAE